MFAKVFLIRRKGQTMRACFISISPLLLAVSVALASDPAARGNRQPGQTWMDVLPLGNGLMGAMAFGGIQKERIALNESGFWSGRPHDYDGPRSRFCLLVRKELTFHSSARVFEVVAIEPFQSC
jgi:hypothetical protein